MNAAMLIVYGFVNVVFELSFINNYPFLCQTQFVHSHLCIYHHMQGTRWRSWLRHCTTSQKVAGSIPDGVSGFFHCHNPSGRTMALG